MADKKIVLRHKTTANPIQQVAHPSTKKPSNYLLSLSVTKKYL